MSSFVEKDWRSSDFIGETSDVVTPNEVGCAPSDISGPWVAGMGVGMEAGMLTAGEWEGGGPFITKSDILFNCFFCDISGKRQGNYGLV